MIPESFDSRIIWFWNQVILESDDSKLIPESARVWDQFGIIWFQNQVISYAVKKLIPESAYSKIIWFRNHHEVGINLESFDSRIGWFQNQWFHWFRNQNDSCRAGLKADGVAENGMLYGSARILYGGARIMSNVRMGTKR